MIESKKGSYLKIVCAIAGSCLLLVALYFLNKKDIVYGGILAVIGILLIVISVFPLIKSPSS
jgi:hypothetical protein